MSRFSLNAWSDWGFYRGRLDVTLIRLSFDSLSGSHASLDVVLLGFGVSLTWYAKGKWT